jgi:germination protein M
MSEKKSKKNVSLGILFWIAFILLIIVLFFFKRTSITNTLDSLGAKDLFSGPKKETVLNGNSAEPVIPKINTKETPSSAGQTGDGSTTGEPKDQGAGETPATAPLPVKTDSVSATESPTPTDQKNAAPQPSAPSPAAAPAQKNDKPQAAQKAAEQKNAAVAVAKNVPKNAGKTGTAAPKTVVSSTRVASLYFVQIDADGKVIRQQVSRNIEKSDSPLSETLDSLFRGTTQAEKAKGYRSLIPEGTRLLSAIVKDGVATVNVSDEFQFNQFGIEGYLGQLAQVVFTATSFPTVKSVQFLIEGQRRDFLGAEGVYIGTPLSRDKF